MKPLPPLASTGIGSVPYLDPAKTFETISKDYPALPYWPQMTKLFVGADMIIQFAKLLPFLNVDEGKKEILVKDQNLEQVLLDFYEHFLSDDIEYFSLPGEAARIFEDFISYAQANENFGPHFLKGQVTGPITFGQAIRNSVGTSLLDLPELSDPAVKALGANAAWQAGRIRDCGRTPLIFFDEPSLTGFGSGFSTLNAETVKELLNQAAEAARAYGEILVGMHVCGNTDWPVMLSTTLDVINFDAFGYLDNFLLYPNELAAFFNRGGYVAWGIVPTLNFTGNETAQMLAEKLMKGFETLASHGLELEVILNQSLITPACGLGPLPEQNAYAISRLTAETSEFLRRTYGI